MLHRLALRHGDVQSLFYSYTFSLTDAGIIEHFGYALEAMAIVLFYLIARQTGQRCWYAWAAIMAIILADDSLHFHEFVGQTLQRHGLLDKDLGEVIGFAMMGIPVAALWIYGVLARPRNDSAALKTYGVYTLYVGILIFFAIFVDSMHALLKDRIAIRGADAMFDILEDGMEQVMVTLLAATALSHWLETRKKTKIADDLLDFRQTGPI